MRPSKRSGGSTRWSSTEMIGEAARARLRVGQQRHGVCFTGAPHHSTGPRPGVGAVALHDVAVDDRGHEPVGALQHALRSRGEVVHDLHWLRRDRERVEHVEVGLEPGLDRTAVAQAVDRGGLAGEDLHRGLERQRAAWPLAHPVREQERRVAGVADEVDVGAAVAQAEHGLRVRRAARRARRGCPRSHRGSSARAPRRRRRWSSRRGAPRGRGPSASACAARLVDGSGSYSGTGCDGNTASACASIRSRRRGTPGAGRSARIAALHVGLGHAGGALGDGQVRDRLVRGAAAERVRRAQPAEQALPVRADLRDDARAVGVLALDAGELVAPVAAASCRRTGT